MGDFGDDFDMDDLIEEDAGFGGGDADEEEMMNLMESTQTTTGATGATGAPPASNSPTASADDDDLDRLAQAGATQAQGEGAGAVHPDGEGDDDSEDEDEAQLFAGYKPPPLASNARADAPVRSALDIEGDAVAVTSADGRRAFVRAEPKGSAPAIAGVGAGVPASSVLSNKASSSSCFLLGESIDAMLDRIEARRRDEALAEAERLKRDADLGREGVRARDKANELEKKKRDAKAVSYTHLTLPTTPYV